MYLLVDVTQEGVVSLRLFSHKTIVSFSRPHVHRDMLQDIRVFLLEQGIDVTSISGVAVVMGHGSFTSTRLATIIANTWRLVFDVPVVAVPYAYRDDSSYCLSLFDQYAAGNREASYISPLYSGNPRIGGVSL